MKKIVQKYNYQIWAFLIAVIPRMILSLFAYPIRTMSDELGTISNGAFLAGLDWSAVASESGYYGSGLSLFFAPFISCYVVSDLPFIWNCSINMFLYNEEYNGDERQ